MAFLAFFRLTSRISNSRIFGGHSRIFEASNLPKQPYLNAVKLEKQINFENVYEKLFANRRMARSPFLHTILLPRIQKNRGFPCKNSKPSITEYCRKIEVRLAVIDYWPKKFDFDSRID